LAAPVDDGVIGTAPVDDGVTGTAPVDDGVIGTAPVDDGVIGAAQADNSKRTVENTATEKVGKKQRRKRDTRDAQITEAKVQYKAVYGLECSSEIVLSKTGSLRFMVSASVEAKNGEVIHCCTHYWYSGQWLKVGDTILLNDELFAIVGLWHEGHVMTIWCVNKGADMRTPGHTKMGRISPKQHEIQASVIAAATSQFAKKWRDCSTAQKQSPARNLKRRGGQPKKAPAGKKVDFDVVGSDDDDDNNDDGDDDAQKQSAAPNRKRRGGQPKKAPAGKKVDLDVVSSDDDDDDDDDGDDGDDDDGDDGDNGVGGGGGKGRDDNAAKKLDGCKRTKPTVTLPITTLAAGEELDGAETNATSLTRVLTGAKHDSDAMSAAQLRVFEQQRAKITQLEDALAKERQPKRHQGNDGKGTPPDADPEKDSSLSDGSLSPTLFTHKRNVSYAAQEKQRRLEKKARKDAAKQRAAQLMLVQKLGTSQGYNRAREEQDDAKMFKRLSK